MTTRDKIREIILEELLHKDLYDDLDIEPTELQIKSLTATANLIATQLSELIDTDYIPRKEVVEKLKSMKFPEYQIKTTEQLNLKIDQLINSLKGEG